MEDIRKLEDLNSRIKKGFESLSHLPIKLKEYPDTGEYVKSVNGLGILGRQQKDTYQITLYCPECEKEDVILFEYFTEEEHMQNFLRRVGREMVFFRISYCKHKEGLKKAR